MHPLDLLHRIKTVIDHNRALAKDLGISSMSGFIVGTELVPRALDLNGLNDLVANIAERKETGRHSTLFITRRSKTMNTIPFTNRQSIVKGCVVGILGLAVLFESTTVTLAAKKLNANAEYCNCSCTDKTGKISTGITWLKHAGIACIRAEGTGCTIGEKGAPGSVPGTKKNCDTCRTGSDGNFSQCNNSGFPAPPNGPGSEINPYRPDQNAPREPKFDPRSQIPRAGGGGLIAPRGVEGEPAPTAPTGEEDKATAPK